MKSTAEVRFSRAWAMPSPDTFSIPPIADLLDRWITTGGVIIDPFARNSRRGTLTNDLNPDTAAMHHMTAEDFSAMVAGRGTVADVILFDPPYSPRQISEVYASIGKPCGTAETQNGRLYKVVKDHLSRCAVPGTIAICCGWNSGGFGKGRGFELRELLLVGHGGAHNDTIVTVEVRTVDAPTLFEERGLAHA